MRRVGQAGIICSLPILALLVAQTAYAAPSPAGPAKPATAAAAVTRDVSYDGVRVSVPAAWPVIDLALYPSTCIRLDRSALYLGSPGAQSNCPAHAVGRADTIWLRPAKAGQMDQQANPSASQGARVGTLAAQVSVEAVSHDKHAQFVTAGVQVDATWGANSSSVDRVLASAVASPAPATPALTSSATAPTKTTAAGPGAAAAAAPQAAAPAAPAPASVGGAAFTGKAFDTCAAPSAATMRSWLSSPYRAVGVYIGGSQRACGDGNLSAAWVAAVNAMGWRLIPTYVGPQAPCVNQSGLGTISASSPSAQGVANASDAVTQAKRFGMGPGTPIYYDMEAYNPSAGCSNTVTSFISGWTSELHALGYKSGTYGSPGSLMTDMSSRVGSAGFAAPDDVWFAHWNGTANTSDQGSYPGFPDGYWAHHRVHQYSGNLYESWGGVGVSIDADWVDGEVAGVPAKVASSPYEVAFQANTGSLWSWGSDVHGDWGQKMMAGTSPSITALSGGGYEMAFQTNAGSLITVGSAGTGNWGLGMKAGTSPSITALSGGGYEMAFQANTGHLWSMGSVNNGDWGLGMKAGSSPSITGLSNGSFEFAFQANTGNLWSWGSVNKGDWGLGMMGMTSPSITALSGGGYEMAFQANTGHLWSMGSVNKGDWGLGMKGTTSPSIGQ